MENYSPLGVVSHPNQQILGHCGHSFFFVVVWYLSPFIYDRSQRIWRHVVMWLAMFVRLIEARGDRSGLEGSFDHAFVCMIICLCVWPCVCVFAQEEQVEWYGLTVGEAIKKLRLAQLAAGPPPPLKLQYRAELIEKLKTMKDEQGTVR